MRPTEILAAARRLLERPDARMAGVWPRAAALLARQAFESGLDELWGSKGVALDGLATKPQLICLSAYLPGQGLAASARHAWSSLSRACHHHPYELAASHGELRGWIETVAAALAAMQLAAKAGAQSGSDAT